LLNEFRLGRDISAKTYNLLKPSELQVSNVMLNSSTGTISKEDLQQSILAGLGRTRLAELFDASEHTVTRSLKLHWGTPRLTEIRKILGVPGPQGNGHNPGVLYQTQGFRWAV
jgi:hypothetical protein